ncbi:MAG: AAA family ATPase [Pirellulaceae bacterium]
MLITGKNGSGKTSLLLDLEKFLNGVFNGELKILRRQQASLQEARQIAINQVANGTSQSNFESQITNWIKQHFGGCNLIFHDEDKLIEQVKAGTFILAFFPAKRNTTVAVPTGIQKINLPERVPTNATVGDRFLQYIVNLKADRSFAKDDGKIDEVQRIDKWFHEFTEQLRDIFDAPDLILAFDRQNYTFEITIPGQEPFGLNVLSDGYSAILSIVVELLMRMEPHRQGRQALKSYDMEGIVLVDEIETHLHVDLQKKILPFLTTVFPSLQFVVSTHSPFVLSSLSNATICDLENRFITEDLSGYSYDALIESYFDSDKYSDELKAKLVEYEKLSSSDELSRDQSKTLFELETYFDAIPKQFGPELAVKLQQIKLDRLNK